MRPPDGQGDVAAAFSSNEGETVMGILLIFAGIGLLVGAAARLFYPGRQPVQIAESLLLGILGALAGGAISWSLWPQEDGQFQAGNIVGAMIGAALVLAVGAVVAYGRRLAGTGRQSS